MRLLLTIVDIVVLVAVLAIYLFWVGRLLSRIADNLDTANDAVKTIIGHAEVIAPGVEHINRTGGVVAGALPLLYGHAERIAARESKAPAAGGVLGGPAGRPDEPRAREAAAKVGRRRSRLTEALGYRPDEHT